MSGDSSGMHAALRLVWVPIQATCNSQYFVTA